MFGSNLPTYERFNIISIDPGTSNCGFCVTLFNDVTKQVEELRAHTVNTDRAMVELVGQDYQNRRGSKLVLLKNHLEHLIQTYQPAAVACEAAFYNPRRPGAYGPLVEVITVFKTLIEEKYRYIPFVLIEPRLVKKLVKVKNVKDKDSTKHAMKALGVDRLIDLSPLDDHSVDSISVGYAYLVNYHAMELEHGS